MTLLQEESLDRDAAQQRQVHNVCILDAVAETPTSGDQRVLQLQRTKLNREVGCGHRTAVAHARWLHATWSPAKTGPSRHERTKRGGVFPSLTGTTQL